MHIAHASFWTDNNGKSPDPFTTITYDDLVIHKKWKPRDNNPETQVR